MVSVFYLRDWENVLGGPMPFLSLFGSKYFRSYHPGASLLSLARFVREEQG